MVVLRGRREGGRERRWVVAKWAKLRDVDLLTSQQGGTNSKKKLPRYRSGKNQCTYLIIMQQKIPGL